MAAPMGAPSDRVLARDPAVPPDVADAVHHLERAEAILARRDPVPADLVAELIALRGRVLDAVGGSHPGASSAADPTPHLVVRQELAVSTGAPRLARSLCRETCTDWALPSQVVSTVTDLASELVANAVRHTRSPMRLSLERSRGAVVLSVWDDGVGVPHVLPYRPGISERGLGLRLVKQLSSDWGWGRADDGKWVWARIAIADAD